MINFYRREMLQKLLIFSLCFVAIKATGEFTILSNHKALSFKGNDLIQSHCIGEVLYASLGKTVNEDCNWGGLTIGNPFELPKWATVVSLYGAEHSQIAGAGKTYKVQGNSVDQSLNLVSTHLKADNSVCSISFEQLEEGRLSFINTIGNVQIAPVAKTKYLNGDLHIADKQFLESCAYVKTIADNLVDWQKLCDFTYINLFVDDIAKAHGENSNAVREALDVFAYAVKYLQTAVTKYSKNEALLVVAVNKADGNTRTKRETVSSDAKTLYNLAEYYSQDYPVIFNIILWFMVVFGFALLAICYAIGSMDPGRDSIIYRMTSTRMKKDN